VATLLAALGLGAAFLLARRRAGRLLGDPGIVGWNVGLRDAALWLGLLAVVVAGLGPRFGQSRVRIATSGVDLVVLVDTSRSMDATDIAPSRLGRARRSVRDVLDRLPPESRAALAGFAGRGVLFTPLTPDHVALSELLPAIETELIRPGGSDLAAGIDAALEAFEAGSHRPRVMLVLSDGETSNRRGDAGEAALRTARVRLMAATFGSPLGSTVPDHGTPLRDGAGEIVVSRRHDETLRRLAAATGGQLFDSDSFGRFDIEAAVAAIERDALPAEEEFVERAITVPVVWPFAAIGFVLLWLELVAPTGGTSRWRFAERAIARGRALARRRGGQTRLPGTAAARLRTACLAPLLLLVAAVGEPRPENVEEDSAETTIALLEARARYEPLTDRKLVELGIARAEVGRTDAADQAFRAAALGSRNAEVAAVAYHNLGVGALERGELETARDAFFDALAVPLASATRAQTRYNLEWTLAALRSGERDEEPPLPRRPDRDEDGEREGPRPEFEEDEGGEEPSSSEQDESGEPPLPEPQGESERRGLESGKGAPGATPVAESQEPPPLSADERRQWLQRVEDDPSRALLSALAAPGSESDQRAKRGGPTW
jgi:Ca-activated chloride channel family protein